MWLLTLLIWFPLLFVLFMSLHWMSGFYEGVVSGHAGLLGLLYALTGFV